jgi:hypothetical protein
MWIVQEFAISPVLHIRCGLTELAFQTFYASILYTHFLQGHLGQALHAQLSEMSRTLEPSEVDGNLLDIFFSLPDFASSGVAFQSLGLRRRYQNPKMEKYTLLQNLARVHVTRNPVKSSVNEDRVFGLLGLATDTEPLGILPDYSKSCATIYTEISRAIILSGQIDLLSLCQRHKTEHTLPSWVTDWRGTIVRPSGRMPWDTCFAASKGQTFHRSLRNTLCTTFQLCLDGFRIDYIESLGTPWTPDDSKEMSDEAVAKYLTETADFCQASDAKFKQSQIEIYTIENDRVEAHIRVPVADQEQYGFGLIRKASRSCLLGHALVLSYLKQPQRQQAPEEGGYKIMLRWQQYRRPFLSAKGYAGLAPDHAEEGDIAVIFSGAKFPYILRNLKDGTYQFIGEAYVHGIMYGDLMSRNETEMEEFVLR